MPTAEEIYAEISPQIQPLRNPLQGIGGLPDSARIEVLDAVSDMQSKHRMSDNGKVALERISQDIFGVVREARRQERWPLVLGACDAYEVLHPDTTKTLRYREMANVQRARPKVSIKGFFEDQARDETYAFLKVRVRVALPPGASEALGRQGIHVERETGQPELLVFDSGPFQGRRFMFRREPLPLPPEAQNELQGGNYAPLVDGELLAFVTGAFRGRIFSYHMGDARAARGGRGGRGGGFGGGLTVGAGGLQVVLDNEIRLALSFEVWVFEKRVRVGEEFLDPPHTLRLVEILGKNRGVRLEYMAVEGFTFDVF